MNARDGIRPPAGLLLIGHGTRDEVGTRQFLDLAAAVARQVNGRVGQASPRAQTHAELAPRPRGSAAAAALTHPTVVRPSFLELQQPAIEDAIKDLAEVGVEHVVAVPLLLFAAGHAKRDIPERLAAAAEQYGITTTQTAAFGCEPAILELSRQRMREAVTGRLHVPAEETCLLLVGRGSRDESATAQMQEFAQLRQEAEGGIPTEIAFLAMARPSLDEQLPRIAVSGFRRVIVQPHLLFQGELASSLARQVQSVAQNSRSEWLLTPLLADLAKEVGIGTKILADVICERYRAATIRVVAPAGED